MAEYYISYNEYFGFCVIETINGTGKIVFAGSIEDCNRKCIELNSQQQPKRSDFGASAQDGNLYADDGKPNEQMEGWFI